MEDYRKLTVDAYNTIAAQSGEKKMRQFISQHGAVKALNELLDACKVGTDFFDGMRPLNAFSSWHEISERAIELMKACVEEDAR